MDNSFYFYTLASKRNSTLNIGITSDLLKRTYKHKKKMFEGFSKKYNVDKLVYYEVYKDAPTAITREKRLKNG